MLQGVSPQIESILAAGNHAYSNMNCQPWHFVLKGLHIDVHIQPNKDQSPYNWSQRMSYFTTGAVIENMAIAASANGYKAEITLFPTIDPSHVAAIELTSHPEIKKDDLAPEIFLRATNRKRFLPMTISDAEQRDLVDAISPGGTAQAKITTSRQDVKRLAEIIAIDDTLIFSNRSVHDFFFGQLNWSDAEDKAKGVGLNIRLLELQQPTLGLYYLLKYWQVCSSLSQMRFFDLFGTYNRTVYESAAAMGCITIPTDSPEDYVNAGRSFERLWLTATKLGLSLQPLNGIPYLMLKLEASEVNEFSAQEKETIETGYKNTGQIFANEDRRIVCIFRIGGGAPPSGRSVRDDLTKIVTIA